MADENGSSQQQGQPPGQYVTIDQVVAWNLAWYRNQAGLTQQELADLVGTSKGAISEMERSWNGKRPREFKAQFLASAATKLGIPLMAFYLPPFDEEDDDEKQDDRFWFTATDGQCGEPLGMRDLLILAMPDNDERTDLMDDYRYRLRLQVDRLLDAGWARDVARWQRMREDRATLARRAARLRFTETKLRETMADVTAMAEAIEASLAENEEVTA